MAEGVLVGRHNAQALDAIVRQWEANGRRLDSARAVPTSTSASAPIVQAIEVTSGTADSDGYPARIQLFDGTSWTDSYAECRAVKIGGGALTVGFYPPGRLMRVADSGLHVYGIHPGAAASGGTELKGLTFTSDTDSTADSDPGAGLFKWNNATQSLATTLYFDLLTADGVTVSDVFGSINGGGYIYLQQADDSTKWQMFKLSSAPISASGYYKFPVTRLDNSGGSIADAKTVYTKFISWPIGSSGVLGALVVDSVKFGSVTISPDTAFEINFVGAGPAAGTLSFRYGGGINFYDETDANPWGFSNLGGVLDVAGPAGGWIQFGPTVIFPSNPPASASATGNSGEITWDGSFLYVCVAADTWKRVAIATW